MGIMVLLDPNGINGDIRAVGEAEEEGVFRVGIAYV